MKIYIASSFDLIEEVELLAYQLELRGHVIDVKWWERIELKRKFSPLEPDLFYRERECKYAYERDLKGIRECDLLVLVTDGRTHTGANVEIGMALALGKPVFSLGKIQNSAMYYPVMRMKTKHDFFRELKRMFPKS